jgi:hypothetical protein
MIVYSYYRELADEDGEVFTPDGAESGRSSSRATSRGFINLTVRGGGGGSNGNVVGGRMSRNVYAPEPTPGASIYPNANGGLKHVVSASELSPQTQMMLPPPQPTHLQQQQQPFMHQMQQHLQQQPYVMSPQFMADPNAPPPAYNYGGYYCPS